MKSYNQSYIKLNHLRQRLEAKNWSMTYTCFFFFTFLQILVQKVISFLNFKSNDSSFWLSFSSCDHSIMKTLEKYQKYSYSALESSRPTNDTQVINSSVNSRNNFVFLYVHHQLYQSLLLWWDFPSMWL